MSENPINLSAGWWLASHTIDDELPRGGNTDRALFPNRYTANQWLIERIGDSIGDLEDYISDFEDDARSQGDNLEGIKMAVYDLRATVRMLKGFPLMQAPFEVVFTDVSARLVPVALAWQEPGESE